MSASGDAAISLYPKTCVTAACYICCSRNILGEEPSVLDEILDSLEANSSGLLNVHDPPLYQYAYDDQYPDRLTNGGNNLFDPYGMMVIK